MTRRRTDLLKALRAVDSPGPPSECTDLCAAPLGLIPHETTAVQGGITPDGLHRVLRRGNQRAVTLNLHQNLHNSQLCVATSFFILLWRLRALLHALIQEVCLQINIVWNHIKQSSSYKKNPVFLPASTISERSAVTLLSDAADVACKIKYHANTVAEPKVDCSYDKNIQKQDMYSWQTATGLYQEFLLKLVNGQVHKKVLQRTRDAANTTEW